MKSKRSSVRNFVPDSGGRCTSCGKVRYTTRAGAKTAIKRMRGQGAEGHLSTYRCGDFWHIGHLPAAVVAGQIARDDVTRPSRAGREHS